MSESKSTGSDVAGRDRGQRFRRACLVPSIVLGLLAAVLVVRAMTLASGQIVVEPAPLIDVDQRGALERLREGLRIRTISHQDGVGRDDRAFEEFRAHLERSYPKVHATLELERVSGHSLLFRWAGRDPERPVIVLQAHQDVVPVDPKNIDDWTHPPFDAVVADGFVWGRGALDDKLAVFALLEAVEGLLSEDFTPRADVYLAFGHDEELGGESGAVRMAALLADRRVPVGLVVDEGGSLIDGIMPGFDDPIAVVGIAEKGYLSVSLDVEESGGHSSVPPPETVIGILSSAIVKLQQNPFPARLEGASRAFFEQGIGPEGPFAMRLVLANIWLLSPLLERVMGSVPGIGAMLRTTTAPTIIEAGLKDNVLPSRGRAVVNFRVLPGETTDQVVQRVRVLIDDERVRVTAHAKRREPSPPSRIDSEAYATLARSIREVFPDTVVAPYLMVAGTDSRYFRALCDCVYRFLPIRMGTDDLKRAHGTNERIPVDGLVDSIRFYRRLIENASAADLSPGT